MRSVKAIRIPRHRQRIKNMIKDCGSMNLEEHVKDDNFNSLVNYNRNQWLHSNFFLERGLLRSIDKYKALRSCLIPPNEHGILDSLWNICPYDRTRTYTKLVIEFIHEYVN